MGIVQQQTIKGTFYSYLGVAIGFISLLYFQTKALTTEQVGLINILSSFSLMFAQFAILGFNGTARYFPYFRNEAKKNHGYLFLACTVSLCGFVLFTALAYFFKDQIISSEQQKSDLFDKYFWYLIPLTFFTLFFNVFDLYARMQYDTTTGRILNEFTKRLLLLFAIILIFFKSVSFETFMLIWLAGNVIPTFFMFWKLKKDNRLHLQSDLPFLTKDIRKNMIGISVFATLTGCAPLLITNIDKYMINDRFGLSDTGIYTIAAYLGTIITLPSRSLYGIAYTIVAEAWAKNDLPTIKELYEKSCVNQLIAALLLFILIWANIHNIFEILPPNYGSAKYVIFFMGLGYLIDSATGINAVIIATSKYYKFDSYFHVFLVGLTIVTNLFLIPIYGITGAAIAACITFLVFNLFRYAFIFYLFKLQPYNLKAPLIILLGIIVYGLSTFVPQISNYWLDIVLRSGFILISYIFCVYYFNLSEDIVRVLKQYSKKYIGQ